MTPRQSPPGSPSKASALDFYILTNLNIGRTDARTGKWAGGRQDGRAGGRAGRWAGERAGRTWVSKVPDMGGRAVLQMCRT